MQQLMVQGHPHQIPVRPQRKWQGASTCRGCTQGSWRGPQACRALPHPQNLPRMALGLQRYSPINLGGLLLDWPLLAGGGGGGWLVASGPLSLKCTRVHGAVPAQVDALWSEWHLDILMIHDFTTS